MQALDGLRMFGCTRDMLSEVYSFGIVLLELLTAAQPACMSEACVPACLCACVCVYFAILIACLFVCSFVCLFGRLLVCLCFFGVCVRVCECVSMRMCTCTHMCICESVGVSE